MFIPWPEHMPGRLASFFESLDVALKTMKHTRASAKMGEGRGSQHNLFRFCSTNFAFSIRWHHFRSVDCHITRAVCSFLTRHTSICILSWAWIPVHVHHFHVREHFCAREIVIIFLSLSHSLGTRVHHKLQQKTICSATIKHFVGN